MLLTRPRVHHLPNLAITNNPLQNTVMLNRGLLVLVGQIYAELHFLSTGTLLYFSAVEATKGMWIILGFKGRAHPGPSPGAANPHLTGASELTTYSNYSISKIAAHCQVSYQHNIQHLPPGEPQPPWAGFLSREMARRHDMGNSREKGLAPTFAICALTWTRLGSAIRMRLAGCDLTSPVFFAETYRGPSLNILSVSINHVSITVHECPSQEHR